MNAPLDIQALNAGFTDEATWLNLVTREAGHDRRAVEFLVPDMRCTACAARIEAATRISGVEQVAINPARHLVAIEYQPSATTLGQIVGAIEAAGYTPGFTATAATDARLLTERRQQLKRIGVAGIAMVQVMMYSIALYAGGFQGMDPLYVEFFRWTALIFTTPVVIYSAATVFRQRLAQSAHPGRHRTRPAPGWPWTCPWHWPIGTAYLVSVHADRVRYRAKPISTRSPCSRFSCWVRGFSSRACVTGWRVTTPCCRCCRNTPHAWWLKAANTAPRPSMRATCAKVTGCGLPPAGRVAADGTIVRGNTELDESALTGEAAWVARKPGDRVFAGTMNIAQTIEFEATAAGSATRIAAMHPAGEPRQPRPAGHRRHHRHRGPLFCRLRAAAGRRGIWFLVVCRPRHRPDRHVCHPGGLLPLCLVVGTPAAITAATTALRRVGFVVTRAHVLERMARATNVIFDKTGTLTSGVPRLTCTTTCGNLDADSSLAIAVALETHANHPLARAFANAGANIEAVTPRNGTRASWGRSRRRH